MWLDGSAGSIERLRTALADALAGGEAVVPLNTADPHVEHLREVVAPHRPVEDDTAVLIPTSGSTGTAKGVLLSASALTSSAEATHRRLGGGGSWLLATPAQYIGGLQVVVRALLADTRLAALDLSGGFNPEAFAAAAGELRGTSGPHYTALVPTQLARLLDAGGAGLAAAVSFDAIVLGGAALDPGLRERAEAAGVRPVPSYGMSETASGCVYDGVPLDGVRVRLGSGDRIEISGDVLAHGYRLRPDLTAESFVDGWLRTNDRGALDSAGVLHVLGRVDDVVNTGGVKVSAAVVEQVLTAQPGVSAAAVVALPDPEWGEIVAAAVTPAAAADTAERLREAVRAEAGAAAVPKVLCGMDTLPLRGPGKVDKSAVREELSNG